MIDRNFFVVLVILCQPNEGVVYFTGSNGEVVTQSIDVSNWSSNPNDSHNIGQIRWGKRKEVEKLRSVLWQKNNVALQTEMRRGVSVLKMNDAPCEMRTSYQ